MAALECRHCDITFDSEKEVRRHRRLSHAFASSRPDVVECDTCGRRYPRRKLAEHQRRAHGRAARQRREGFCEECLRLPPHDQSAVCDGRPCERCREKNLLCMTPPPREESRIMHLPSAEGSGAVRIPASAIEPGDVPAGPRAPSLGLLRSLEGLVHVVGTVDTRRRIAPYINRTGIVALGVLAIELVDDLFSPPVSSPAAPRGTSRSTPIGPQAPPGWQPPQLMRADSPDFDHIQGPTLPL